MTEDVRLTRFYNDLQLKLPGALLPMLQQEFKNVLREFFIDTNIWIDDIDFTTRADITSYDLVPDTPSVPVRLMRLANTDNITVRYATMPELGTILLAHAPNGGDVLTARVSLTITSYPDKEGNPVFPKWVLDRWYDTLLDGVLARMFVQAAKPYSSPQMATYHQKRYLAGKAQAKHTTNMDNTYGGQRWRFPVFA